MTIGCSALTFSPGTTWRLPTIPGIGTASVASRMPTRVEASCACADLSAARAASTRACEVCSAVGEMKFCAARPTLAVFWRSASTSAACADSTSAARSAARLCRSARSISPITWPALTRLPSTTPSDSSVPAALARTMAVRGATSGPENSSVSGRRVGDRPGDLGRQELERHGRLLALAVAAEECLGDDRGRERRDNNGGAHADPEPAFRLVGVGRAFGCRNLHGRECRTAAFALHAPCDGLRIGGGERQRRRTKSDWAQSPARSLRRARGKHHGRRQRRRARRPEHRREAEALAERAAGDAADHARSAVAEHGVERLAAAAQPPREVARDDGDARRVLGREGERVQAAGRRRAPRPRRRTPRSSRSAAPTRARRRRASRASTRRWTQRPWK